jgi:hypothetical protein
MLLPIVLDSADHQPQFLPVTTHWIIFSRLSDGSNGMTPKGSSFRLVAIFSDAPNKIVP